MSSFGSSGPQPMKIGNLEKREVHYRGRAFQGNRGKSSNANGEYQQRMKDMRNRTCFVCHKEGCQA